MRRNIAFASAIIALSVEFPAISQAQEAQPTAEPVSQEPQTLPPVVVFQPKTVTPASTPHRRKPDAPASSRSASQQRAPEQTNARTEPEQGTADTVTSRVSGTSGLFGLGAINLMGGTYITPEQTWYFAKQTLDQALTLAPGVTSSDGGSSRNERLIFVRGFDREQVPLYIDGVRVFMPYDNRLDFADFVTPDIAEIQIAKGYASVLDGPGAIGGAINLVTKRPTKEIEAEAGWTMSFARDGSYEGTTSFASAGTRQKYWYALVTGALYENTGWMLSDDFVPTANQGSGWRNNSERENWRVSAKVGVTPNATDEYAFSVIHQEASKGAPLPVNNNWTLRYWDWPQRDLTNIYENSTTRIGESSYVNTKAFYMMYNDSLYGYDNATLTTQTKPSAFRSYYNDTAYGAQIESGSDVTRWDTLKGAFFYRRDTHNEYQDMFTNARAGASCGKIGTDQYAMQAPCVEPTLTSIQDTYSAAIENTIHVTSRVDFVTGVSYDWRVLQQAEGWALNETGYPTASNGVYQYPTNTLDAPNWQSALVYRYQNDAKVYASVSQRTRFPTLFELFSLRFGSALPNPDLAPETATNWEIGWAGKVWNANLSTAFFYSDVTNFIESVYVNTPDPILNAGSAWVSQSQNVGNGHFIGWEGAADIPITSSLSTGGNVTLIRRDIVNPRDSNFELTGVPDAKGIVYVKWYAIDGLSITPNVQWASTRWTSYGVTAAHPYTVYYQLGAYAQVNISAEYELRPGVTLNVVAQNLLDENYSFSDGYPEAGRSVTVGMKMKF